jgi:hypothetical protein
LIVEKMYLGWMRLLSLCATLAIMSPWLLACGDDTAVEPGPGGGGSAGQGGEGGSFVLPVCAANEAARPDGSCVQVGVELCGDGFTSNDGGCEPIAPDGVCPAGTMKVLGEADCVDIAPCQGKWGSAPIEPGTQFVDVSYANVDSDGSEQKPWTTIADGIANAGAGDVVAVAAGSYPAVVELNKAVRLWGACASGVVIESMNAAGVFVSAADAEIHDLSVTNSMHGIVSVVANTLLEGVWVHDTTGYGLYFDGDFGTDVSGTVRHTAIHSVVDFGIAGLNANLVLEDVHIDQPLPDGNGESGRAIRSRPGDTATTISIDGVVVERAYSAGVQLAGVTADISRLYVNQTQGREIDRLNGTGVDITPFVNTATDTTYRPAVTIDASVIAQSLGSALHSEDATTVVSNTVLRDVQPNAGSITSGQAVDLLAWVSDSSLTMRTSLIERSVAGGVFVASRGVEQGGQGHAEGTFERVWVRDVAARADGKLGIGVAAQGSFDGSTTSVLTVRDSLVERTVTVGILALDAEMTVSGSEVRDVRADDNGDFGDAITIQHYFQPSELALQGSVTQLLTREVERAGIANFGAVVAIDSVWIDCGAFPLNGEASRTGVPYEFNVSGDNRCTCADLVTECRVLSSGLAPPDPFQ